MRPIGRVIIRNQPSEARYSRALENMPGNCIDIEYVITHLSGRRRGRRWKKLAPSLDVSEVMAKIEADVVYE